MLKPTKRASWYRKLSRWLWALMLVLHTPALIGSWKTLFAGGGGVDRFGVCLALSASTLLFVLKMYDVSFLRLRTNRYSLIALGLVVLLVHGDVLGVNISGSLGPDCVPIMATTLLVGHLKSVRRFLKAVWGTDPRTVKGGPVLAPAHETVLDEAFRPYRWHFAPHYAIPRAPPA